MHCMKITEKTQTRKMERSPICDHPAIFAINSFILAMWFLYMCAAYVIQTVDESILKQKYEQAGTVTATLSDALEENIESDETAPITDAQTGDGKQLEPISSSAAAELYLKQPQKQFDHAGLSASNQDYRFWIDIPGTRITTRSCSPRIIRIILRKN